jgi:hypothetical protein
VVQASEPAPSPFGTANPQLPTLGVATNLTILLEFRTFPQPNLTALLEFRIVFPNNLRILLKNHKNPLHWKPSPIADA